MQENEEYTCQICLDQFQKHRIVFTICQPMCGAQVCTECLKQYIEFQISQIPNGIVAPILCPHCKIPVNLLQWKMKCSELSSPITQYSSRITSMCNIQCPSCDEQFNVLPISKESSSKYIFARLSVSIKNKLPPLIRLCRQYCRHQVVPHKVVNWIQLHIPASNRTALFQLLALSIHDVERRYTLLASYCQLFPLIVSTCCGTSMCYNCKSRSHIGRKCPSQPEKVFRCPGCSVSVTKGDGCDSIRCLCGVSFSWTSLVVQSQLQALTPTQKAALIKRLRRHVWSTRFHRIVLPQMLLYATTRGMKSPHRQVYLAICELIRTRGARTQWNRLLEISLKAQVIREAIQFTR